MKVHPAYIRARQRRKLFGWLAVGVGIIGIALPFAPGLIPILFGISLLSVESRVAHRVSARFRARHHAVARSLREFETFCIDTLRLSTHTHEYVRIPSRDGSAMQGLVERSSWDAGVAVLLHSTSGTLETGVQNVLAEACRAQGLTVVRFDARCGLNEDGANFLGFTVSGYRDDLEDVLLWARTQPWWNGPLTLVGHSAGALVAGLYAAEHPADVAELVLLAPTVSGKTYVEAFERNDPRGLQAWRESRLRTIRHPLSGDPLSLSYAFVEDLLGHDLMPVAAALTMPVTILCGGQDVTSPPAVCADLASAIGPHARLVPVPSMRHAPEHLDELRTLARTLSTEMKS